MTPSPHCEFFLARSNDLVPIASLDDATGKQLQLVFNRAGSFSGAIDLDSDDAKKVVKHATAVIVQRNDVPIWSGGIINTVKSASANKMSFTAQGWLSELDRRFVRPSEEATLAFSGIAGGSIVSSLLSTVNSQQDSGGTTRPTHLTFASYSDTQVRTRSYKRGQSYGSALQELVDVENGLDVYVDPMTRRVTTRAPTEYIDWTKTHLIYGQNLDDVVETDDGTKTANRFNAVGSNGVVVSADDSAAIQAAGVMLEEWQSISDVSDVGIIGAYANAELVYRAHGQKTYALSPSSLGDDALRPFDNYSLGGKLYFSADVGALRADHQAVRAFSLTIDYDDGGNEVVSELGVTAS